MEIIYIVINICIHAGPDFGGISHDLIYLNYLYMYLDLFFVKTLFFLSVFTVSFVQIDVFSLFISLFFFLLLFSQFLFPFSVTLLSK